MWVRITKNCVTLIGPRCEGDVVDLNDVTLKGVPKDCYKRCLAPWEQAQKDAIKAVKESLEQTGPEIEQQRAETKKEEPDLEQAGIKREHEKTKSQNPKRQPPKKH